MPSLVQERLSITNWLNAETTFTVESDLPYVGGAAEITLPAHGTGDYEFYIHAAVRQHKASIQVNGTLDECGIAARL